MNQKRGESDRSPLILPVIDPCWREEQWVKEKNSERKRERERKNVEKEWEKGNGERLGFEMQMNSFGTEFCQWKSL